MGVESSGYLGLDAVERSTTDEEDVLCVHLCVVLVRVLASALGGYVDHRAFEELEESLLHALAADVARDAGVVRLAGYLVDLVDEDDTALRLGHIVVGHLQESREDALHVLADIARLCEDGGVDDGERHVQEFGYGACEERLARSRGSDHDDIALLDLHARLVLGLLQALVMVIDGHGQ